MLMNHELSEAAGPAVTRKVLKDTRFDTTSISQVGESIATGKREKQVPR